MGELVESVVLKMKHADGQTEPLHCTFTLCALCYWDIRSIVCRREELNIKVDATAKNLNLTFIRMYNYEPPLLESFLGTLHTVQNEKPNGGLRSSGAF